MMFVWGALALAIAWVLAAILIYIGFLFGQLSEREAWRNEDDRCR